MSKPIPIVVKQMIGTGSPNAERGLSKSPTTEDFAMYMEPILRETNRISAIPLDKKYEDIWNNYKIQKRTMWFAEKVLPNLMKDKHTYPTLPDPIKKSLKVTFGFLAGSDEIVEENLNERFIKEIKIPEIKYAYVCQAFMENIHSEMYNLVIERVMYSERMEIFRAVENLECVRDKANWAKKWISSMASYAERCVAFVCVEGIFFSSSFLFIDWLKTQDYELPGIYESNLYISNDEARHMELACLVYKHIIKKASAERVKEIVHEAIEIEHAFVREVVPAEGYKGMNRSMMCQHVTHAAAIATGMLGYPNLLGSTSTPFSFATKRSLSIKDNFFEQESVQYNIADVGEKEDTEEFSTSGSW